MEEQKFIPEDEVTHMIRIVTVQRDNAIAQLNDAQMENYRLRKIIDSLSTQVEESTKEITPGKAEETA